MSFGVAEMNNEEYITLVNKTSRPGGVGGKTPLCYRLAIDLFGAGIIKEGSILDFGCGKHAVHINNLREQLGSYFCCYGHDIGANDPGIIWAPRMGDQHDLVIASNVANVQPTVDLLLKVLGEMWSKVRPGGYLLLNHPKNPRYHNLTTQQVLDLILFNQVDAYHPLKLAENVYLIHKDPGGPYGVEK
jgi:SAM-dependent methyltransferase